MPATLHTPRLVLEPWAPDHDALLAELCTDPAVMRHIGNGSLWDEQRVSEVSARIAAGWREHGFGWRAIIERSSARGIGLVMLAFPGDGAGIDPDEYEIGWWLSPARWGQGLAREAAAAVRDEAFSAAVHAPSVVARVAPANTASLALAQALGLVYEREGTGRTGEPIVIMRLTRPRR